MLQGYIFFLHYMNNLRRKLFTNNISEYLFIYLFIIYYYNYYYYFFIYLSKSIDQFRFKRRLTLGRDKEDILRMREFELLINFEWKRLKWTFTSSLTVSILRSFWSDLFVISHEAPIISLRLIDWKCCIGRILNGFAGLQIRIHITRLV